MKKIILFLLFAFVAVTVTAMFGRSDANAHEQPLAQAETVPCRDSTKTPDFWESERKINALLDKKEYDQKRAENCKKPKSVAKSPKTAPQGATMQKVANTDNFSVSRPKQ